MTQTPTRQIALNDVTFLFNEQDVINQTVSEWRSYLQSSLIDTDIAASHLQRGEAVTNSEYYRELANMAVACLLAMDDLLRHDTYGGLRS
jgi:hypothetical protein